MATGSRTKTQEISARFKANIRRERLERGLTQSQVARAIGVTQPTYQQMETGPHLLGFETIVRIADALGLEPGRLFDR